MVIVISLEKKTKNCIYRLFGVGFSFSGLNLEMFLDTKMILTKIFLFLLIGFKFFITKT